jgi:hypothetical protein
VISIAVVEGWRVLVSEERATELVELGLATVPGVDVGADVALDLVVRGRLGRLVLTEAGARELLALTDARALDLVRRRIEGTL